jgi:hypothetical protein
MHQAFVEENMELRKRTELYDLTVEQPGFDQGQLAQFTD